MLIYKIFQNLKSSLSSYLVSMLFADLLSLHLVTFLMFSIFVHCIVAGVETW